MSLINCPECGKEVSTNATACPNCARPLHAPPVERKVFVTPPTEREEGFPTWALIPIGLMAAVLIFVAYLAFRDSDDTANMNVNVSSVPMSDTRSPATSSVPSTSTSSAPVTQSAEPQSPSQTTTVPGSSTDSPSAPPDKGKVVISVKTVAANGSPQAVRGTRFYLLEQDVETVLREARVEPIAGNSLAGSLGLATVFPDRYGDFQRAAMRAIAAKAKYSGTTDGSGGANLSSVDPKGYYLFGIAKIGRGFALWNAPVSVIAGDNMLNLSPQSVTEIADPNS